MYHFYNKILPCNFNKLYTNIYIAIKDNDKAI